MKPDEDAPKEEEEPEEPVVMVDSLRFLQIANFSTN
jgi:hypothetical protein